MRVIRAIGIAAIAAFPTSTSLENCAFAQTGRAPSTIQRRVDQLNRQGEEYEREQLNEDLKGRPDKPRDRKQAQALAAEVEQDFKDLQESYNMIVLAMAAKTGFAYDSVSDAINEISKCSTRLKHNLALPQQDNVAEKGQQPARDSGQIDELLLTLRKHIYSFVTNPLFESKGVLNIEQAKGASSDLDRIIELSKTIKRNSERSKENSKPAVDDVKPEN